MAVPSGSEPPLQHRIQVVDRRAPVLLSGKKGTSVRLGRIDTELDVYDARVYFLQVRERLLT